VNEGSAFRTDDERDRDLASDRRSRYGAYVAQWRHVFHDEGSEHPPTTCPLRFAVAAWTVATPPIMAPGYVTAHPRIQNTAMHWDDDSRVAVAVHIAVPAPPVTNRLPSRWSGWARDSWSLRWQDPYNVDGVTVLSSLTIRIPLIADRLPTPQYEQDVPNALVAKEAVAAICRIANAELEDLLSALDTPTQRRPSRAAR